MSVSSSTLTARSNSASLSLKDFPYLQRLERLQAAYPALKSLLNKLRNHQDEGRRLVAKRYADSELHGGTPGRCAIITFKGNDADHELFDSAQALTEYFAKPSDEEASSSGDATVPVKDEASVPRRRLFILEDMDPGMVDVLGRELRVNPVIFSEQMNTWNSTDSQSVPFRSLASLRSPKTLFTLRYYEIRTLDDEDSVRTDKNQMTHAVNRRKIERWRDVDLPSVEPDKRHALVRRAMSFWTSEDNENIEPDSSWDALILVDPPMDSCSECAAHNSLKHPRDKSEEQVTLDGEPSPKCAASCLMLEDPKPYKTRKDLWTSRDWNGAPGQCPARVKEVRHNSTPYHGGCVSLIRPSLTSEVGLFNLAQMEGHRRTASPFDDLIFHMTQCKQSRVNAKSLDYPVNSAFYMLNFIAHHWAHQIDLIAYGVNHAEWFNDDHAVIDSRPTLKEWKAGLSKVFQATKDINYMRRQLSRFDRALTLNMERVGVKVHQDINDKLPSALQDAQEDFLTIASRLGPLRERVDDLTSIANEVASLRAAFKSIQDGEQSLWLSLFAAIIFPLTLVASMLSMSDNYLPGHENFWVFWAASIPLALVIGLFMLGRRPKKQSRQFWEQYVSPRLANTRLNKQQHKTPAWESV